MNALIEKKLVMGVKPNIENGVRPGRNASGTDAAAAPEWRKIENIRNTTAIAVAILAVAGYISLIM